MSNAATRRIYNSRRWRAVRQAALARAEWRCQVNLPGCTRRATQADHIISLEEGGHPYSFANTQASCRHCNVAKENLRRQGGAPLRDW